MATIKPKWCNKHEVIFDNYCSSCIEGVPVCYKCKTTDNLSRKTRSLMICRTCRNQYAREHSRYQPIQRLDMMIEHIDMEKWNKQAKESAKRISEKHGKA